MVLPRWEPMKGLSLLLIAVLLLAAGVWFFHLCGSFLVDRDYLAGLVHVFVGAITLRAGVQLARLAVVIRLRSP